MSGLETDQISKDTKEFLPSNTGEWIQELVGVFGEPRESYLDPNHDPQEAVRFEWVDKSIAQMLFVSKALREDESRFFVDYTRSGGSWPSTIYCPKIEKITINCRSGIVNFFGGNKDSTYFSLDLSRFGFVRAESR